MLCTCGNRHVRGCFPSGTSRICCRSGNPVQDDRSCSSCPLAFCQSVFRGRQRSDDGKGDGNDSTDHKEPLPARLGRCFVLLMVVVDVFFIEHGSKMCMSTHDGSRWAAVRFQALALQRAWMAQLRRRLLSVLLGLLAVLHRALSELCPERGSTWRGSERVHRPVPVASLQVLPGVVRPELSPGEGCSSRLQDCPCSP